VPKLFCPSCMKPVSVPDDFAGREVTCPSCGKVFDAPAKYTPTVLGEPGSQFSSTPEAPKMSPDVTAERSAPVPPPPVPPGLVPAMPAAATAAPPMPAGFTRARGISFNPRVIAWLPAILLTITFLCTFAAWVGMYLGGYAVYSQGPWSAMVGALNPNPPLIEKMPAQANWMQHFNSDWELMVPYLLVLILATALALSDRGLSTFDPRRVFPPLAGIWEWRKLLILILAATAFALAFTHVLNGFGLERAVRKTVHDQFAKEREEAVGNRAMQATVEYKEDQELAKYNLERTSFLYIALLCNLLAVVSMLVHTGLERRGYKPPPRLVIQY
jgi:hypothetical protein